MSFSIGLKKADIIHAVVYLQSNLKVKLEYLIPWKGTLNIDKPSWQ